MPGGWRNAIDRPRGSGSPLVVTTLALLALATLAPAAPARASAAGQPHGHDRSGHDRSGHEPRHHDARRDQRDRSRPQRRGARCRPSGAEDRRSPSVDPDRQQIKLIYAHFDDRPDNYRRYLPLLERDVTIIQHYIARRSHGRKTLRFDLGTECAAGAADVLSLKLPIRRQAFLALGGIDATRRFLARLVRRRLGRHTVERRDFLVILDRAGPHLGLVVDGGLASTIVSGWGDMPLDDSHGRDNVANLGGLYAVVKTPDFQPHRLGLDDRRFYQPEMLLHEITHMLGAVQRSAPHAAVGLHCSDGFDVMCREDSTRRGSRRGGRCRRHRGDAIPVAYDCGSDDYFSVRPAKGSYLASHWNLYDSAFMAPCAERPRSCGHVRRRAPS